MQENNSFFSKKFFITVMVLVFSVLFLLFFSNAKGAPSYSIYRGVDDHWAFNDLIGWIDFNFVNDTILCDYGLPSSICISSQELRGVASSSWGKIYMNCNDMPLLGGCGISDFKVINDGVGGLSGYAWNDIFGWISFRGSTPYQVQMTNENDLPPSTSYGWAWNPVIGWISFNCEDMDTYLGTNDFCNSVSSYKVMTDWYSSSTSGWVESTTYDTGVEKGVQFNSISWRGASPLGTRVSFYFAASSTPSGPWNYSGPYNSDTTMSPLSQNPDDVLLSAPLDYTLFNNARYFRYKVFLYSDSLQTVSPTVEEVIVNWSP